MQVAQLARKLSYPQPAPFGRPDFRAFTGFTARLAADRKTRQEAFALRHTSYLAEGHIDSRPDGLFCDPFDDAENCATLVVYQGVRAVASVRVCVLDPKSQSPDQIPAQTVFPNEISNIIDSQQPNSATSRIVEINRLVRHPDFNNDFSLVWILFRLAGYMILRHKADMVLSCTRPNHLLFYKRLKFQHISGPRLYHGVNFATHLLACPRDRYDNVQESFPLLRFDRTQTTLYDRVFFGASIPVSMREGVHANDL